MLRYFAGLIITLSLSCCTDNNVDTSPSTDTVAEYDALVVSAHEEASRVGMEVMKNGGNAVDAAIATYFALAVTYPQAGNLGGGGFMVVRMADGETYTLDFREKAPAAASRDMYLDDEGNVIDGLSTDSVLAVGVPGSVAGMWAAHRKLGTKGWFELITPSKELASFGYKITAEQAADFNNKRETFIQRNGPDSYLVKDEPWKAGDTLIQRDIGRTLSIIGDKGRAGFYESGSPISKALVQFMSEKGGLITSEDLENYEPVWRDPIEFDYKDHHIISMPPPSSGGVALAQLLQMLEVQKLHTDLAFNDPKTIHLIAEIERRVYAERSQHLGDIDFYKVPLNLLLAPDYCNFLNQSISMQEATVSDSIKPRSFTPKESSQTTHFSVVDAQGNAVSITTTLNSSYGSKYFVPGWGFLLNNEMDDFSSKPGHPNLYGLVGSEANAIEPGKRMLSSMTPTIVVKNDQLFMVLGSPGGSRIITAVFQSFLNVVEFDMSVQEAVDAPRFHHQWLPDTLYSETGRFDDECANSLISIGHALGTKESMGSVNAIMVMPNGKLQAGADNRRANAAVGY